MAQPQAALSLSGLQNLSHRTGNCLTFNVLSRFPQRFASAAYCRRKNLGEI